MVVHAHPDDESSSTGGTLAHYSDLGVRTVVVTCTDGALGDSIEGFKPGEDGHDPVAVAAWRKRELEAACQILRISHLEMLGYADSGMSGWEQNARQDSFWTTPLAESSGRLADLMVQYRPQVVATYGSDGGYGHPDHIRAHQITVEATRMTGIPKRALGVALARKSRIPFFVASLTAAGIDLPGEDLDEERDFGTADDLIVADIDCSDVVDRKFRALAAHASQTTQSFFLEVGPTLFGKLFSIESYFNFDGHVPEGPPITDLFSGID